MAAVVADDRGWHACAEASFADIRLGPANHVGMRRVYVLDEFDALRKMVVDTTNDGKIVRFDVERLEWGPFQDRYGNATIPYRQVVRMETATHKVDLDFMSAPKHYLRLIFAYEDHVFSDFEGVLHSPHATHFYGIQLTSRALRSRARLHRSERACPREHLEPGGPRSPVGRPAQRGCQHGRSGGALMACAAQIQRWIFVVGLTRPFVFGRRQFGYFIPNGD